jgi:hypothetical protein
MGKTAFAQELLRLYPASYLGFAEGKEGSQARDYACLTKAVEYFVERQICTKDTTDFKRWISDFCEKLSDNTRKILPLLPKLQRLVSDEESKRASVDHPMMSPFLSPKMQPSETSSR